MTNRSTLAACAVLTLCVPALGAQVVPACGPGNAFGIVAYRCASCTIAHPADSTHTVYSFGTEPVVLETGGGTNRIHPGDAVVAVNGYPITTRAGADRFAYPRGETTLTVRRNGGHIDIEHSFADRECIPYIPRITFRAPALQRDTVGRWSWRGSTRMTGQVPRVMRITTTPGGRLVVLDTVAGGGVRITSGPAAQVRIPAPTFGFDLVCHAGCTPTVTSGIAYWRFEAPPSVVVIPGGPAERAGLRDGDVLVAVNGLSPASEEGALLLHQASNAVALVLEVRRGTERLVFRLRL